MSKKILLLVNLPATLAGGAQKRYLALFDHLNGKRDDYFLVINRGLFEISKKNNFLTSDKNVILLDIYQDNVERNRANAASNGTHFDKRKSETAPNAIRQFLGRQKTFFKSVRSWWTFSIAFRKVVKQINPGIVYAVWTGGVYAWPLKKLLNFRLIYSYNDSNLSDVGKKYWQLFNSEYWILKNADKVDFLSEGIVKAYEKKFECVFDKNRLLISPNSFIDYTNFYSHEKDGSVIFLSRLMEEKNPLLFLEAISMLNQRSTKNLRIKYYVVGNGQLKDNVINYIKEHALNNVLFEDVQLRPWEYLRKTSIFVSLQRNNNYPSQALIEAMACENAIIASDVGETRLLVTENEGILIDLDAVALANAIEELVNDPDKRSQMGKNARKKVLEKQTIENFAEHFVKITN